VRLTVELDGRPTVVEVAADLGSVRVGAQSYPVRLVARGPARVDLEIAGETVAVVGWPEHNPTPTGPVDVNGERWPIGVETGPADAPSRPAAVSLPASSGSAVPAPAHPSSVPPSGEGVPVVPPMPGRVIELRVAEGDHVTKGQTLLVLEAMKMRGEVPSPAEGVVRDIRVTPGSNARAKEPMMWVRGE